LQSELADRGAVAAGLVFQNLHPHLIGGRMMPAWLSTPCPARASLRAAACICAVALIRILRTVEKVAIARIADLFISWRHRWGRAFSRPFNYAFWICSDKPFDFDDVLFRLLQFNRLVRVGLPSAGGAEYPHAHKPLPAGGYGHGLASDRPNRASAIVDYSAFLPRCLAEASASTRRQSARNPSAERGVRRPRPRVDSSLHPAWRAAITVFEEVCGARSPVEYPSSLILPNGLRSMSVMSVRSISRSKL
jgi:hypothetical protein